MRSNKWLRVDDKRRRCCWLARTLKADKKMFGAMGLASEKNKSHTPCKYVLVRMMFTLAYCIVLVVWHSQQRSSFRKQIYVESETSPTTAVNTNNNNRWSDVCAHVMDRHIGCDAIHRFRHLATRYAGHRIIIAGTKSSPQSESSHINGIGHCRSLLFDGDRIRRAINHILISIHVSELVCACVTGQGAMCLDAHHGKVKSIGRNDKVIVTVLFA